MAKTTNINFRLSPEEKAKFQKLVQIHQIPNKKISKFIRSLMDMAWIFLKKEPIEFFKEKEKLRKWKNKWNNKKKEEIPDALD